MIELFFVYLLDYSLYIIAKVPGGIMRLEFGNIAYPPDVVADTVFIRIFII